MKVSLRLIWITSVILGLVRALGTALGFYSWDHFAMTYMGNLSLAISLTIVAYLFKDES